MSDVYRFQIEGPLSPELVATFHPLSVSFDSNATQFACLIEDKPHLFGIVARCETLGLNLISMSRTSAGTAKEWK